MSPPVNQLITESSTSQGVRYCTTFWMRKDLLKGLTKLRIECYSKRKSNSAECPIRICQSLTGSNNAQSEVKSHGVAGCLSSQGLKTAGKIWKSVIFKFTSKLNEERLPPLVRERTREA